VRPAHLGRWDLRLVMRPGRTVRGRIRPARRRLRAIRAVRRFGKHRLPRSRLRASSTSQIEITTSCGSVRDDRQQIGRTALGRGPRGREPARPRPRAREAARPRGREAEAAKPRAGEAASPRGPRGREAARSRLTGSLCVCRHVPAGGAYGEVALKPQQRAAKAGAGPPCAAGTCHPLPRARRGGCGRRGPRWCRSNRSTGLGHSCNARSAGQPIGHASTGSFVCMCRM